MFSNLRQGSQLYILHKSASTPFVEMGSVESTSNSVLGYYPAMANLPINISVRIGESLTPYNNLPSNAEVADASSTTTGETVTIACSKDVLNAEVQSLRQKSIDAINSVEWHKQRVSACDTLLEQLNPEQAERAQREKDMASMREQMNNMARTIAQLTAKISEGTSSTSKKKGD